MPNENNVDLASRYGTGWLSRLNIAHARPEGDNLLLFDGQGKEVGRISREVFNQAYPDFETAQEPRQPVTA